MRTIDHVAQRQRLKRWKPRLVPTSSKADGFGVTMHPDDLAVNAGVGWYLARPEEEIDADFVKRARACGAL